MENSVIIKEAASSNHWVSFSNPICQVCGFRMKYSYHGNPRALIFNGKLINIIQSYYICNNEECSNREQIVARHPEILYKKKYSRSDFVRIISLRYNRKFTTKQLLEEVPYISKSVIREMIQSFRAAHRAMALS